MSEATLVPAQQNAAPVLQVPAVPANWKADGCAVKEVLGHAEEKTETVLEGTHVPVGQQVAPVVESELALAEQKVVAVLKAIVVATLVPVYFEVLGRAMHSVVAHIPIASGALPAAGPAHLETVGRGIYFAAAHILSSPAALQNKAVPLSPDSAVYPCPGEGLKAVPVLRNPAVHLSPEGARNVAVPILLKTAVYLFAEQPPKAEVPILWKTPVYPSPGEARNAVVPILPVSQKAAVYNFQDSAAHLVPDFQAEAPVAAHPLFPDEVGKASHSHKQTGFAPPRGS